MGGFSNSGEERFFGIPSNTDEKRQQLMLSLRCNHCGAWEGKPHPLRGYKVELATITCKDKEAKVCQSCRINELKNQSMNLSRGRSAEALLKHFVPGVKF